MIKCGKCRTGAWCEEHGLHPGNDKQMEIAIQRLRERDLARLLYEAHGEHIVKTYSKNTVLEGMDPGLALCPWPDLKPTVQQAWQKAAGVALRGDHG